MANVGAYASSCQLTISPPAHVKENLGMVTISASGKNDMWFSSGSGDKTPVLNFNDLYEVTDSAGSRYFRLNGKAYNHTGSAQTYIYDLAYGFGVKPPPGYYLLKSYSNKHPAVFGRTITTIGDSITWWQNGRYLRCMMRDAGLKYDFAGNNFDIFGFQHDGNGGYNTDNVLSKMPSIKVSDAYFLLIGTNDRIESSQTVANIIEITEQLHQKNPYAKIYVSTILPRNDDRNGIVQDINTSLRNYDAWCNNCKLIDLGGYFYRLINWPDYLMPDALHPNYNGQILIANYITKSIEI